MTTDVSAPLTAIAVWPEPEIALKAYSEIELNHFNNSIYNEDEPTWYNRPSGEKTVRYLDGAKGVSLCLISKFFERTGHKKF